LAPATVSWVGGASGSWALGSNWSTDALQGAGDDVVIAGMVTVTLWATQCLGRRTVSRSEAFSIPLTLCGAPVGK